MIHRISPIFCIYLPFFHPLEVHSYIFGVQKCHSAVFSAVSQLVENYFFDKLKGHLRVSFLNAKIGFNTHSNYNLVQNAKCKMQNFGASPIYIAPTMLKSVLYNRVWATPTNTYYFFTITSYFGRTPDGRPYEHFAFCTKL